MSVLIPHELKHQNVFDKSKTVIILKNRRVISVIYEAMRTIEGARYLYTHLLPHHTHCPCYIHRTGNLVQMCSWYFIPEH